ncbi:MAG TPA: 6-phosphogluconolactonase [Thermoplasmata archaeon]|nr:6-phosphogluconolactonase [Thermoplasmata archaeon]HUJ77739.1 6-phosphogluconolactonase [Thermoplasmata archaeon]
MTRVETEVRPDPETASADAAEAAAGALRSALAAVGRARLAVSGGETPRRMLALLAAAPGIAWRDVEVYFADERFVPRDSPLSNQELAAATILAAPGGPSAYPVPVDAPDAATAAARYEALLRERFAPDGPALDLALLGVGPDGHTASLFPGSAAAAERERWVAAVPRAPQPPPVPRVSLTFPFLDRSRHAILLATGPGKRGIVARVLAEARAGRPKLPAARVSAIDSVTWFLDADAAGPP